MSTAVQAEETIVTVLAKLLFLETGDIKREEVFTVIGLDSILAVEFVDHLRTEFYPDITLETIYEHATPRTLAAHLASVGTAPVAGQ
ncbi:acyl carrier protein [Crossiella equi]|uniref:Acyl carrier protein n=1 Tax=Crossiella equi TaxID=130796 RepID=A0ABS5AST3_9PSEU|nr:acyl carrier protein [Crossiella equi]MBP2479457.1 acyl carrier protein [Crossiella equi]